MAEHSPDDTQLQIFNELRGELQGILGQTKLLKQLARKVQAVHVVLAGLMHLQTDLILNYVALTRLICIFWRPVGPSEQNLTFVVHACCDPSNSGEYCPYITPVFLVICIWLRHL